MSYHSNKHHRKSSTGLLTYHNNRTRQCDANGTSGYRCNKDRETMIVQSSCAPYQEQSDKGHYAWRHGENRTLSQKGWLSSVKHANTTDCYNADPMSPSGMYPPHLSPMSPPQTLQADQYSEPNDLYPNTPVVLPFNCKPPDDTINARLAADEPETRKFYTIDELAEFYVAEMQKKHDARQAAIVSLLDRVKDADDEAE